MRESKFDGKINRKPVKVIVRTKTDEQTMYFAKPKESNVRTPHFYQNHGVLSVHQHSDDGHSFRVMKDPSIGSGSFISGKIFVENKGFDLVILPMRETANGFWIDTSPSGSYVTIPSGSEWCLMAFGRFGPWRKKGN